MKPLHKLAGAGMAALMIASVSLPTTAEARSYPARAQASKPCPVLAKELRTKINRLKKIAAQRRAQGDAYGQRKLLNTANVIAAHWGNLPCVGKRNCSL